MHFRVYFGKGTQHRWFSQIVESTVLKRGARDQNAKTITFTVGMVNDPVLDQIHDLLGRLSFIEVKEVTVMDDLYTTSYLPGDGEYEVSIEDKTATIVTVCAGPQNMETHVLIRTSDILTAVEAYKRYRGKDMDKPTRDWCKRG